MKIIDVRGVGQFGRLWISGAHSDIVSANAVIVERFGESSRTTAGR